MDKIENLEIIDSLDFRNNKQQLIMSYLLRLIGVLIFGFLYFLIAKEIYQNDELIFRDLIEIEIESFPSMVSIILIIIDVIAVIYLHELIHAAVFYFANKQKPIIGIRGFIIFAAAPKKVVNKYQMVVNAFAPFFVISLVGFLLMAIIPLNFSSWLFIPMVINASAAAGDFMTVFWILKQPKDTKFIDKGDITYAYNVK